MAVKSMDGSGENDLPSVVRPYLAASPNPLNPVTEIRFGLPRTGEVNLDIYNLRGARVIRLVNEVMEAGHHVVPGRGSMKTVAELPAEHTSHDWWLVT